jgi:hypothetical protein
MRGIEGQDPPASQPKQLSEQRPKTIPAIADGQNLDSVTTAFGPPATRDCARGREGIQGSFKLIRAD